MNVVRIKTFYLYFETGNKKVFLIPGNNWNRVYCEPGFLKYAFTHLANQVFYLREIFQQKLIMFFGEAVITFIQAGLNHSVVSRHLPVFGCHIGPKCI